MNLISHILAPAHICADFAADDKAVIFEQAATLFEDMADIKRKLIINALAQREQLGSTGLGQGVAIPHGRIKGLKTSLGAFIRCSSGIDFGAPDDKPVDLIFIMLVPEQANESHLNLLSELAQMFSGREFREALLAAPDSAAIYQLFCTWSLPAEPGLT